LFLCFFCFFVFFVFYAVDCIMFLHNISEGVVIPFVESVIIFAIFFVCVIINWLYERGLKQSANIFLWLFVIKHMISYIISSVETVKHFSFYLFDKLPLSIERKTSKSVLFACSFYENNIFFIIIYHFFIIFLKNRTYLFNFLPFSPYFFHYLRCCIIGKFFF